VIAKALDDAKCVVVLWSNDSVNSSWVKEEASVGKRRDILIPARIDLVDPPLGFGLIHTADLTDWKPDTPHFECDSLLKAISEIVGPPPAREPETGPVEASPAEQDRVESDAIRTNKELPTQAGEDSKNLTPMPPEPTPEESPPPPSPVRKRILVVALGIGALLIMVIVAFYPSPPPKTTTNRIGMKFVLIPAGTFTMGSPTDEQDRYKDEKQHEVTITKPFYLQTTEATQGQWKAIMGSNPSLFDQCGDDCPVENVSWDMVQEFIRKLNTKEGSDIYRLPSEAEWEYACRAGTRTRYYTGNLKTDLNRAGWHRGNSHKRTFRVGKKEPNSHGLYDMHGNVEEWCEDWYDVYPSGAVTDPPGPSKGWDRVSRGGGGFSDAPDCRSACRNFGRPGYNDGALGFRLSRSVAP